MIKISIEIDLPRWARHVPAVVAGLLVTGLCATVSADVTLHPFMTGDILSADDLNTNFKNLAAAVNDLQSQLDVLKKGPNVCGFTTPTMGQIGGYAGARARCQKEAAVCQSNTVHMCTGDEVTRFLAMGNQLPGIPAPATNAWVATGVASDHANSGTILDDCLAFTSGDQTDLASSWVFPASGAAHPNIEQCNSTIPVMCCD